MRKYGVLDIPIRFNGVVDKDYIIWNDLIRRCYSVKFKEKYPTYVNCTLDSDWLVFSKFKEDISGMIGYGFDDWQLDKDILFKGNKHYGVNTCCFVPRCLNTIVLTATTKRGGCPVGVTMKSKVGAKKPYSAQIKVKGTQKHLGSFATPEEAFSCYKKHKEGLIKTVAESYRDKLDNRVFDSLMSWEISIDD